MKKTISIRDAIALKNKETQRFKQSGLSLEEAMGQAEVVVKENYNIVSMEKFKIHKKMCYLLFLLGLIFMVFGFIEVLVFYLGVFVFVLPYLFIFAKAKNGPPMPLAAVRKQVKDLPIEVILDDSMAMMPTMKLSSFKQVEIVARISKSGSAKAQSGDLQSDSHIASAGQKETVKLRINKYLP